MTSHTILSPDAAADHGGPLPSLMRATAASLIARLQDWDGITQQPAPLLPPHDAGLTWQNAIFSGPLLRRAHVESFEIPGHFAVLHVCIMPHVTDPAPIFGFDMVAGQTQATGIFLDLSAVEPGPSRLALRTLLPAGAHDDFQHHRKRPDWGYIFSEDFLAIRPTCPDEAARAIALALAVLTRYRACLGGRTTPDRMLGIRRGQTAYAEAQRRNPHTFRMLSRYVGETGARLVIDDILFPLPA